MKRRYRLRKTSDFKRVRRMGKSYAHPLVVLQSSHNQQASCRVGVLAGRSLGRAVQRNRAKRRLRAAIRPFLGKLTPGYDFILIARRPLLNAPFGDLQQAVISLLQEAGHLDDNGCLKDDLPHDE